jgi:hypothetical protein
MSVAGLSAHANIDRAHEVANECRKLNKALKECQEAAQTYNNRERLLALPVTNVSAARSIIGKRESSRVYRSSMF